MIYHLIAIIIFTVAVMRGYRKGLFKQIPMFIGFCFGVVCSRLFCEPLSDWLRDLFPSWGNRPEGAFIYSTISTALIYISVYKLFSFCTSFLKIFFNPMPKGMLGSLGGALFSAVRYMLMLSIVYNLLLCRTTDSSLYKYAKADDGNIVEIVTLISPTIIGGESVDDLAHRLQLDAARSIS